MSETIQVPAPRTAFATTWCAQCGSKFGAGFAGFSACSEHRASASSAPAPELPEYPLAALVVELHAALVEALGMTQQYARHAFDDSRRPASQNVFEAAWASDDLGIYADWFRLRVLADSVTSSVAAGAEQARLDRYTPAAQFVSAGREFA